MTTFDRWQDFVDAEWAEAKKATGFTDEAQCATVQIARAVGDVPFDEWLDHLPTDRDDAEKLLFWLAYNRLGVFPIDHRERLLIALAERSPAFASVVWLDRADLSESEAKVLWDRFSSVMTTVREKVLAGEYRRASEARRDG